ncbi:MAG: hypothetical protein ACD_43C00011G0003 [uncultured bacterium]|nr:MAG: hypothetical protein ACD_43C00011G0003 [uncultured bacterium]
MPTKHHYIAVIDFGSQFAHLIARRIRQHGVLAKIFTPDTNPAEYADAQGIILSGGPKSTIAADAVPYDHRLFNTTVPILGLCYGHQLMALHFGGKVTKGKTKEYGQADVTLTTPDILFSGLEKTQRVWMSHWDVVGETPKDFVVLGKTTDCSIAIMRHATKPIWSCQFHLEVHHTVHGMQVLENFLFKICRVQADWQIDQIEQEIINAIKIQAGKTKHVFLLLSGGVDSTVAYVLLEKALGKKRVHGLHVDNGFMRLRESTQVMVTLKKAGFGNLHVVDASQRFLRAVDGVVEPELKRQAIGELFVEIANEEMTKVLKTISVSQLLLGQGTIYPDTIESGGTKHADKIKTHHNQIDLIKLMTAEGKVIEPLRSLYKDEVRVIGRRFKIAKSMLERQPFPGPGLSIRTLCAKGNEVVENGLEINRKLAATVQKYCATQRALKLEALVLPVRSVGVQGDERSYKHPAVIIGKASWQQLNELSVRITNEVFEINRVLWLVEAARSAKQTIASTAQIQERYLTKDRLDVLRVVDDIVLRTTKQAKVLPDIWQFPIVLVPFGLASGGGESIVLRPIQSQEAMTVNFYRMSLPLLTKIRKQVRAIPNIDYIFYDVTNKPPATIEWE